MERYPFYSCNSIGLTGPIELSYAKLEESNDAVVDPV